MRQLEEHIFMIGFMGVGKSSTSKVLGQRLGVSELDTDTMIVQQEGRAIAEIFAEEGEEYFRSIETSMLDHIAHMAPAIISCGGGMVMRDINVKKMKEHGKIVLLRATPETIYEHVKDSTNRPLLNGNMNVPYIREMMSSREPKYAEAADIVVHTDGLTVRQVADKVLEQIFEEKM